MKYSLAVFEAQNWNVLANLAVDEWLIYTSTFSKQGKITLDALPEILKTCPNPVLVWDVLLDDSAINQGWEELCKLPLDCLAAVRFLDPGLGLFLQTHRPELKLQLSLERNSHNRWAIEQWATLFAPQLARLVLSNEFSLPQIQELSVVPELELQGCGQLEIFYTPRQLLPKTEEHQTFTGLSLERESGLPHPMLNNAQGTFIYTAKDLYILHQEPQIAAAGVQWLRIELPNAQTLELFKPRFKTPNWQNNLQQCWPNPNFQGFLQANRTDAQFKRLKNMRVQVQPSTIGEVIEQKKDAYTIFCLHQSVQLPLKTLICTPDGHSITAEINNITNLKGEQFTKFAPMGIYQTKFIRYASFKSQLQLA